MADLPITATKVWVPLLTSGSAVLALVLARPELAITDKDALDITTFALLLLPVVQGAITYLTRAFVKQPVDIVTPGLAPNIPVAAGTPWWHAWARYGAVAVGAGLLGVLAYRLL